MDDDKCVRVERLDIESEDDRHRRIHSTLEKLNATSASVSSSSPNFSFLSMDPGRSKPHHIPPPTELLSRLHAFLPALEASNALIEQQAQQDPKSIDIENVDESMEHYIEMNLGLGVFETRTHSHATSSSSSSSDSSSSDATSDSDPSHDDEDDDSDSDAEIITSFSPVRPIKPLPRRSWANRRPQIVVLSQVQNESNESTNHDHGMGDGQGG